MPVKIVDNVSENVSGEVLKKVFIHAIVLETIMGVTKTVVNSFESEMIQTNTFLSRPLLPVTNSRTSSSKNL